MTQDESKSVNVNLQFKGIELLKGSINTPGADKVLDTFTFDINVQMSLDAAQKLVFVIVSVDIKGVNESHLLGSLVASCIYAIENFEEIITEVDGKQVVPNTLSDMLHSISISTTRGLMFSTFKGTFLHNAILPIVVPASFQQQ